MKTVWITGATSGIGVALVQEYDKEEYQLVLSARNLDNLLKVQEKCRFAHQVHVVPLDLSKPESLFDLVEETYHTTGGIDILINNAGISQRSLIADTEFSVDRKLIEVNLLGTIALTKALLPFMIQQGGGKIVVVSSVMGKYGAPLRSSYAAAKHGLHGFFDTLRAEEYAHHIKVLMVCPGFVKTPLSFHALAGDGTLHGVMDPSTEKGVSPSKAAKKLCERWKAINKKYTLEAEKY